ncbi:MAG: kynureninase, partial [Sphingomonas sp.]|nr:kynureninase [Sphingomonas sp.]
AMLGLLALESGVDLMLEADAQLRWEKSVRLHDLFATRLATLCPEFERVTPDAPEQRGSHIAFRHPNALAIVRALIEHEVVGDFRTPDIARFGLTPLTLRYEDVWRATQIIADVMAAGAWRETRFLSGGMVT